MKHRIVILGAGYAGMMAAIRLARSHRHADITLVNASNQFVERIRLHQHAAGQTLKHRPIPAMVGSKHVTFVQGWVTGINPQTRTISLSGQHAPETLPYDTLVYALGSSTNLDAVPGVREHALPIESPTLRPAVEALAATGGRLLIVGGGLTGIESATEIAEAIGTRKNVRVTLLTQAAFGEGLSEKARLHLRRVFTRLGIEVLEHKTITRVERGVATTDSGEMLPFDVCVWAGSFAVAPLAREAGFSVNAHGQIRVDAFLRSVSHPNVYAIGDAAAPLERPGAPIRMACATAMPMAAHASANIAATLAGREPQPFSFAYAIRCISLGRREALIQWVNPDDSPRESITTGRMGVFIKEGICRFTTFSMALERVLPGSYYWPKWNVRHTPAIAVEH